jgi:hypothetical protein
MPIREEVTDPDVRIYEYGPFDNIPVTVEKEFNRVKVEPISTYSGEFIRVRYEREVKPASLNWVTDLLEAFIRGEGQMIIRQNDAQRMIDGIRYAQQNLSKAEERDMLIDGPTDVQYWKMQHDALARELEAMKSPDNTSLFGLYNLTPETLAKQARTAREKWEKILSHVYQLSERAANLGMTTKFYREGYCWLLNHAEKRLGLSISDQEAMLILWLQNGRASSEKVRPGLDCALRLKFYEALIDHERPDADEQDRFFLLSGIVYGI